MCQYLRLYTFMNWFNRPERESLRHQCVRIQGDVVGHGDGISIPSASHTMHSSPFITRSSPVHHLFITFSIRIPSEKKLEVQLALASTSKAHSGSESDEYTHTWPLENRENYENPWDFGGIPVFRPVQYVNTIYTFNHHCPVEKCIFELNLTLLTLRQTMCVCILSNPIEMKSWTSRNDGGNNSYPGNTVLSF